MSAEHVAEMNRLLADSSEVRDAAASLDRRYALTYELADGPGGETVHWTMSLSPDGVRLTLDADDAPDVRFVGDWARMIRSTKASRAGEPSDPGIDIVGDQTILETISYVFATAQKVATIDVEWPAAAFNR